MLELCVLSVFQTRRIRNVTVAARGSDTQGLLQGSPGLRFEPHSLARIEEIYAPYVVVNDLVETSSGFETIRSLAVE